MVDSGAKMRIIFETFVVSLKRRVIFWVLIEGDLVFYLFQSTHDYS